MSQYHWREKIFRLNTRVNKAVSLLAAATLFAMMLLTFVDVFGRTFFNHPISGGFELTELMLAALIYLALPLVTADNSHVEVDLLDHLIPTAFQKLQRIVIRLINFSAYAVLSYVLIKHTIRAFEYEDTTAVLEIPLVGLGIVMVIGSLLTTLSLIFAPLHIASDENIEEDLF